MVPRRAAWGGTQRLLNLQGHLAIALAIAAGCGSQGGSGQDRPENGSEGGWCYGNGTCNAGLVCRSDLCVSLGQGGSAGKGDGGTGGDSGSGGSRASASAAGGSAGASSTRGGSGNNDSGGSSSGGSSSGPGGSSAGGSSAGSSGSSAGGSSAGSTGSGGSSAQGGSGAGGSNSSGAGGSGGTLVDPGLDTTPTTLTSGLHYVVSVRDGKLYNWGFNGSYQLGNGEQTSQSTPIRVGTFDNVVAVSALRYHSCLALEDGRVYCWGANNGWGELGGFSDGMNEVPDVDRAIAVAVGDDHSCALTDDGKVMCWGRSSLGQLGPDYVDWPSVPMVVTLPGIADARILRCGTDYCCVALADRSVQCWGSNYYGQLGRETEESFSATPLSVENWSDVVSIATGAAHACALRAGGSVWCWGDNSSGELGNDSDVESPTPVRVQGLDDAVSISAAAATRTCAIKRDGTAVCWGNNYRGGLGNDDDQNSFTPVPVSGLSGLEAITAGGVACAKSATTYYCWGDNPGGALGNGDFDLVYSLVPVQVADPVDP